MTEEPVSYEIDRKLFCEFVRGMSARNRLVEDLVDKRKQKKEQQPKTAEI